MKTHYYTDLLFWSAKVDASNPSGPMFIQRRVKKSFMVFFQEPKKLSGAITTFCD